MINDDMKIRNFSSAEQARDVLSKEVAVQKLVQESQQQFNEISKDVTKYDIEDFEEESNKKLSKKQEEIERIQKRIEELETKAQTCELIPSEIAELEEKKGMIAGLMADFENEQESVQLQAKKKTSDIQTDLDTAKKLGEMTVEAGEDLIESSQRGLSFWDRIFGGRNNGRSRSIGMIAVSVGNKLVSLVKNIMWTNEIKKAEKPEVKTSSDEKVNEPAEDEKVKNI